MSDIRNPIPTIYGYFNEKFGAVWTEDLSRIKDAQGDAILEVQMPLEFPVDIPTLYIRKEKAHSVLAYLKENRSYSFLTDFTATDELGDEISEKENIRFHLVFHLMNPENKSRIRIKIKLKENETIDTFIPLWPGSNWAEREIFDMFGIRFDGHPDLRRILMDMRWEGHPLRKDYPLRGYQVFLTPEPLDPELLK